MGRTVNTGVLYLIKDTESFAMFVLAIALFIGTCYGQQHDWQKISHDLFNTADLNNDGSVTKLEMVQQHYNYDINGNGKVSRHEYTEYICRTEPEIYDLSHYLYDMYDFNHDHVIDIPDYDIYFAKMDTNGDGIADYTEYSTAGRQAYLDYAASSGLHHEIHAHGHSACH